MITLNYLPDTELWSVNLFGGVCAGVW
jgi:hypothetical protein